MATKKKEDAAAEAESWQKAALIDLETTGLSYSEIGKKYGRARDTVIKLKRLHDVTRKIPVSNKGGRKTTSMRSLSSEHRALGSRLTMFRGNQSYTDVAIELGVSRYVLKMMEVGAHDFTLTELQRISTILGHSIVDIITPIVGLSYAGVRLRKDAG